jgi:protein-disulfide isomerase
VTIVEFADFQCPYCRLAVPALRELQRWYPGRVALVHRHLPIATHPHAKSAAMAAECAAAQGRFDAMHDSLYARVKDLGVVSWTSLARLAGVPDTASFSRCLIEGVPAARLKADADAAARLGIRATPTFLVNGRLVSGYRGFESLNREVEAELRAWRDGAAQTRNFGEAR